MSYGDCGGVSGLYRVDSMDNIQQYTIIQYCANYLCIIPKRTNYISADEILIDSSVGARAKELKIVSKISRPFFS